MDMNNLNNMENIPKKKKKPKISFDCSYPIKLKLVFATSTLKVQNLEINISTRVHCSSKLVMHITNVLVISGGHCKCFFKKKKKNCYGTFYKMHS